MQQKIAASKIMPYPYDTGQKITVFNISLNNIRNRINNNKNSLTDYLNKIIRE